MNKAEAEHIAKKLAQGLMKDLYDNLLGKTIHLDATIHLSEGPDKMGVFIDGHLPVVKTVVYYNGERIGTFYNHPEA